MRNGGLEPPRVAPPDRKFNAHEKSTTYDRILPSAMNYHRICAREGFQAVTVRRFNNPSHSVDFGGGPKIGHSRARDCGTFRVTARARVTTQVTIQNSTRARGLGRAVPSCPAARAAGWRRRLSTRLRSVQNFYYFFSGRCVLCVARQVHANFPRLLTNSQ